MRTARLIAGLLITLGLISAFGSPAPPAPRVVAIGDIHGDLDAFVGILQRTSLVDSALRWIGGDSILVQTGDFLDRGPKTRAVMDLLMQLQVDAARRNGRAVILLGNHEALNIYGDLRFVPPADYASYTDKNSERRQKEAYQAYAAATAEDVRLTREEWIRTHPLGFVEHREAMSASGKYGKWLRTLPAVAKINDSIFLHGGIKPDFASWKLEQINETVAAEIKAFDAYRKYMIDEKIVLPTHTLNEIADAAAAALKSAAGNNPERKKFLEGFLSFGKWLTIHPDGPLWFRGYANWTEAEGTPQIQQLLSAFAVTRFVVGHTPQAGQIAARFNEHVYLIDTGMLAGYVPNGRASALEIQNGKVTPIYR